MSGTQSCSRVLRHRSSDFSIERILSQEPAFPCSSRRRAEPSLLHHHHQQPCSVVVAASSSSSSCGSSAALRRKIDWLRKLCGIQRPPNDSPNDRVLLESSGIGAVGRLADSHPGSYNVEELSWLRCTRYRPPKLPRKPSSGKPPKRRPGSHPRIPFTKCQLRVLEEEYKRSPYLARKDVQSLSDLLHLPQNRIKIWFQNRRARERRESKTLEQTQNVMST